MAEPAQCGMEKSWVKQQLKDRGLLQADLAKHLRVSESKMSKMLSPKLTRPLRDDEAEKIRSFFRPDGRLSYAEMHGESNVRQPDEPITVPPTTERSPQEIVVYRTSLGGDPAGGSFIMSLIDAALTLQRPAKLAKRTDIFGCYVRGDTMAPKYLNGDLILFEEGPPPKSGDHVLVRMKYEEGATSRHVYLRKLVNWTETTVTVHLYNPDKTDEIDMADVDDVVRVLTVEDLIER